MSIESATSKNAPVANQPANETAVSGGNSHAANGSAEANPAINLEKAVRQIVREELGRPVEHLPAESKPTFADAVWWALCVVDVGLLIWWIPENLLSDKKLDFFIKSAAWVGSYLFLLGYAWFKNQFLAFSRRPAFKIVILLLLVVLIPFYVSLLPIFRVYPLIEPENAELTVDGNKVSPAQLRLWIGKHKITVTDTTSDSEEPITRDFELGYIDFFRTWWHTNYRPHWPLLYIVPITAQDPRVEVVIRKQTGDFDPDFVNSGRVTSLGAAINSGNTDKRTLSFFGPDKGVDSIELPYGKYEVFARKADCGQSPIQIISSWDAKNGIQFEELCTTAK